MIIRPRVGIAALVLVLGLTGCASGTTTTEESPKPTAPTTEDPTGTTLDDLQALYVDAGGQCDTIRIRPNSVGDEAGDCDGGALLSTYGSGMQRDSAIDVLQGLQDSNPSPHLIAVGPDWIVNGADAGSVAEAMGGEAVQIGVPVSETRADLTTDEGLCAADAEMTNLELNDAIAPLLGYPADRDSRTSEQDEAIRAYKNAAFERACPARAG